MGGLTCPKCDRAYELLTSHLRSDDTDYLALPRLLPCKSSIIGLLLVYYWSILDILDILDIIDIIAHFPTDLFVAAVRFTHYVSLMH